MKARKNKKKKKRQQSDFGAYAFPDVNIKKLKEKSKVNLKEKVSLTPVRVVESPGGISFSEGTPRDPFSPSLSEGQGKGKENMDGNGQETLENENEKNEYSVSC